MRKELGQYFTPKAFANLTCSGLTGESLNVLDLGCGDGALGVAITSKIKDARYVGVELDPDYALTASKGLTDHEIVIGDALSARLGTRLSTYGKFDCAIGNPPYIKYPDAQKYIDIVEGVFPDVCVKGKSVRSEVIFLAKALAQLKASGQIAFILPKSLFVSSGFTLFRKKLVDMFSDIEVISLPDRVFNAADVSTCILKAKGAQGKKNIKLSLADSSTKITGLIQVSTYEAVHRMDYAYHLAMRQMGFDGAGDTPTLKSLGAKIKRGSCSKSAFINKGVACFHTSDFPAHTDKIDFNSDCPPKYILAQAGDILVPRVGTRVLTRQALVDSGSSPITDSVYRLRVNQNLVDTVLNTLKSKAGVTWRTMIAKGSCAKFITNSDMLSMPVKV